MGKRAFTMVSGLEALMRSLTLMLAETLLDGLALPDPNCREWRPFRRPCRGRKSKTPTRADRRARRRSPRAGGLARLRPSRPDDGGTPAARAGPTDCPGGFGRGVVRR